VDPAALWYGRLLKSHIQVLPIESSKVLEEARGCVNLDALITCHNDHLHVVAVALFMHRCTKGFYDAIHGLVGYAYGIHDN